MAHIIGLQDPSRPRKPQGGRPPAKNDAVGLARPARTTDRRTGDVVKADTIAATVERLRPEIDKALEAMLTNPLSELAKSISAQQRELAEITERLEKVQAQAANMPRPGVRVRVAGREGTLSKGGFIADRAAPVETTHTRNRAYYLDKAQRTDDPTLARGYRQLADECDR